MGLQINQLILILIAIVAGCASDSNPDAPIAGTEKGYELAKKHCATCHGFVPASYLDRRTWEKGVLPGMAPNVGIGVFGESDYINRETVNGEGLAFNDWMQIVKYYINNAPQQLQPAPLPASPMADWGLFSMKKPDYSIYPFARTMLVQADTTTNSFYTSDAATNRLYRWDAGLQATDSLRLRSPAVSAFFYNSETNTQKAALTLLGTTKASDDAHGSLVEVNIAGTKIAPLQSFADSLQRPVQVSSADLNNDGRSDWIICGFGHNRGALYWLEALPDQSFKKHVIASNPGALQVVAKDFSGDGWMDLIVLFAHADESISLLTNNRDGSFTTTRLLSFPPVFGSSSFQLVDFNGDGRSDILYTCGDNADLSPVLKPFHGVYIYLNKGDSGYIQSYFYPINGCTKAIAADFDKDGDWDIASIAFFSDVDNKPTEKFIYLEATGILRFTAHAPPAAKAGRWLCMETADYDRDGDLDILLGNFAKGFMLPEAEGKMTWDMHTPFVVLENQLLKPNK